MISSTQAVARISLSNLIHNIAVARKIACNARFLFIIKGVLYGHYLPMVVQTIVQQLHQNDVLGVTDLAQAFALREQFPHCRILLLHGVYDDDELEVCCQKNLEVVIHHPEQIKLAQQRKHKSKTNALPLLWIKMDSGMGRLGFSTSQAMAHSKEIISLQPHCLMTHFACADEPLHTLNAQQEERFASYRQMFDSVSHVSVANSASILNSKKDFSDHEYVRPGIMLFGFSSNIERQQHWDNELKPVMSLAAPVISIKKIKQGSTVGYGATWSAPQDGYIATLKIGYADGYPRLLSSDQHAPPKVYLRGKKHSIVGRISMDLLTIYLQQPNNVQIGDMAELWGEHISLYDLAQKAQTIPYEMLTSISSRVQRIINSA